MEIETLLKEEIVDEFSRLSKIEVGTDEYRTTVDGLTKLMDRAIEINKFNEDCKIKEETRKLDAEMKQKQLDEQIKSREADTEMKEKQLKEQIKSREVDVELRQKQAEVESKDQFIKNLITIGVAVGGYVLTVWGTNKSLKFEETGTVTTNAGRGFLNKLFHWK
jgi:hypothetical protein